MSVIVAGRNSCDPGSILIVASSVMTTDEFNNRVVRTLGNAVFIVDSIRSNTCCLLSEDHSSAALRETTMCCRKDRDVSRNAESLKTHCRPRSKKAATCSSITGRSYQR